MIYCSQVESNMPGLSGSLKFHKDIVIYLATKDFLAAKKTDK